MYIIRTCMYVQYSLNDLHIHSRVTVLYKVHLTWVHQMSCLSRQASPDYRINTYCSDRCQLTNWDRYHSLSGKQWYRKVQVLHNGRGVSVPGTVLYLSQGPNPPYTVHSLHVVLHGRKLWQRPFTFLRQPFTDNLSLFTHRQKLCAQRHTARSLAQPVK